MNQMLKYEIPFESNESNANFEIPFESNESNANFEIPFESNESMLNPKFRLNQMNQMLISKFRLNQMNQMLNPKFRLNQMNQMLNSKFICLYSWPSSLQTFKFSLIFYFQIFITDKLIHTSVPTQPASLPALPTLPLTVPVPRPPLPPTLPVIPALPRNDIFDMTKGIKTITYILPCLIAFVLFKNHIKQNYNVTHGRLFIHNSITIYVLFNVIMS
ncbi:unnamed protein product [Rhizophagus irregularis]|nr:unnamed protein product [Rhizophagus irregularis]